MLQKLSDGQYFVRPSPGYQRGLNRAVPGYTGCGPFEVLRLTDRDIVECVPINQMGKKPKVSIGSYCFSLAGDWTIVGVSDWSDGTYYPMVGQIESDPTAWNPLGNYSVAGDYGPSETREFHGTFIGTDVETDTLSQMASYYDGDTIYTLNKLYLGKWLISYEDTAPDGYAPMEPTAPLGPWYKSEEGTFTVKFDVWQAIIETRDGVSGPVTPSYVSTETIAGLEVTGSESADDYLTWAFVTPPIELTASRTYPFGSGGSGFDDYDDTVIYIRNIRIFRTL